jgi:hypothetical protein
MEPIADTFDAAFSKTVDLANKMADKDKDADLWDIADGMLAGAIQYWLYSRQPCGDTRCQDCMPISTSEGRMSELKRLIEQLASESEYFHTPTDSNAGRAQAQASSRTIEHQARTREHAPGRSDIGAGRAIIRFRNSSG